MKILNIIFDLDGTLINSLDDIGNSMNKALSEFSLPVHKIEDYKLFVGTGAKNLTIKALPEEKRKDEAFVLKVFCRYREIYKKAFLDKTAPYEGILPLLKELEKRDLPISILSNKPHDDTVYLSKVLFPKVTFKRVYGHRSDIKKKPDPDGALLIARELKIPPENTLYIGDSGVDMKTGKAAGMVTVGVLWGFRDKNELLANGADFLVSSPFEILGIA